MDRSLHLKAETPRSDRPAGHEDDVCFPEAMVEPFVLAYTQQGDVVLDPFAGFGTTLAVAERFGRRAVGVEILPERAEFIRSRVSTDARVIVGDARQLGSFGIGPVNLVVTSPPYMNKLDHPQNPLTGYQSNDGDYRRYLSEIGLVFEQVRALLAPGAHVVVNVANIRGPEVTTLAWDIGSEVNRVLRLEQDVVVSWDAGQPEWLTNEYCLIYTAR
jgi:DNA modification methylase